MAKIIKSNATKHKRGRSPTKCKGYQRDEVDEAMARRRLDEGEWTIRINGEHGTRIKTVTVKENHISLKKNVYEIKMIIFKLLLFYKRFYTYIMINLLLFIHRLD